MKKTELKQILDAQRYFLVSLQCYLMQSGSLPSENNIVETNLDNLWGSTNYIAEMLSIDLISPDEIIRTGRELMSLQKLYSLNVDDRTAIN